ncbi:MAG TPA: SpoIIE family protein phosphatase [Deltaproteobacteria bacterium]|jgi:sigma-B regulation protein RsbU (phosphoserine phosphatase)|nr:SpoIIE family protein phosphatase [Deltaproteobacteria bacterium]
MKNRGLAFKLILFTLSGTMAVFLSAFAYFYLSSKDSMMKYVEENARNLTHSTAYQIENVLEGVEKVPLNYASLMSARNFEAEDMAQLANRMVSANPEIYGAGIAFEPGALAADAHYFSPYCYRKEGGRLTNVVLGDESYHYFTMDWYQIPKELNRAAWTEPYYDEGGGNMIMASFSVPFYKGQYGEKRFQGVVEADIALHGLQEIVSAIKLYRSGYAFLISRNGVFITHPDSSLVMTNSIFSIAEEKKSDLLRRIGKDMISGGEGLVALESGLLLPTKCRLYYAPLFSIGWSLGIVIPEHELLEGVNRLGRMVILIGLAGVFLMAIILMLIARRITRPLKDLSATTVEIALGNLDTRLPDIQRGDEIGTLARSFEEMRLALKDYIKHLTETTAAKERIESELKIARNIQMSFLPKAFPPLPAKNRMEISARLEPAREIGGDLYDYSLIDDDHLFFAVGDVSDKGIPAALFMAVTKTLLKGIAETGIDPSEILHRCNLELCGNNDSMMFVTVFCGILDLRTGRLKYSNAGHEHPIIVRRDGQPESIPVPEGFLLGVEEQSSYQTMEIGLEPGDKLIVYTDGVTDAVNAAGELYSLANLMTTVRSCASLSAEGIATEILGSVKLFSLGIPQADDITVLALSFTSAKV